MPLNSKYYEDNTVLANFEGREVKPLDYAPTIVRDGGNYHRLWDWIMPIVKKVKELEWTNDEDDISYIYVDIFNELDDINIEGVHRNTVTFIRWYNQKYK